MGKVVLDLDHLDSHAHGVLGIVHSQRIFFSNFMVQLNGYG